MGAVNGSALPDTTIEEVALGGGAQLGKAAWTVAVKAATEKTAVASIKTVGSATILDGGANRGVAAEATAEKLVSGETKVVGNGSVAANDASFTLPSEYKFNLDGSVTGPKNGLYLPTGQLDAAQNQIFGNNGSYFIFDVNAGKTSVTAPSSSSWLNGRPLPATSEVDVGAGLPAGSRPQISFKGGKEVSSGTPGSVRPDWCVGNVCSVEVKNYNIASNSNGLINNVSQQALERTANLPTGMTQTIVIDVRGQVLTAQQEFAIRQAIVQKSNGIINPSDISFKRK
jgi:hypothetical protein